MACHLVVGAGISASGELELRARVELSAGRLDMIFENCGRQFQVSAGVGGGRDVHRMVAQAAARVGRSEHQRSLEASWN